MRNAECGPRNAECGTRTADRGTRKAEGGPRRAALWLAAALALAGLASDAAAAHLRVTVRAPNQQPVPATRVTVTPVSTPDTSGGLVTLTGVSGWTATNGVVTFSNLLAGFYRVDIASSPATAYRVEVPATNGLVYAEQLTVTLLTGYTGTNALTLGAGDARYVLRAELPPGMAASNVWFSATTNGSGLLIDADTNALTYWLSADFGLLARLADTPILEAGSNLTIAVSGRTNTLSAAAGAVPIGVEQLTNAANLPGWSLLATNLLSQPAASDAAYTFLYFGDIQMYPSLVVSGGTNIGTFIGMVDWVISNKTALNLQACIFPGDIADWPPSEAPYGGYTYSNELTLSATNIYRLTNAGIPALVIPGNHDVEYYTVTGSNRLARAFEYRFPLAFFTNQPGFAGYYSPTNWRNYYFTNTDHQAWLMLEWGPQTNTLLWASNVLAANRNYSFWITTHAYLQPDGTRINGGAASPKGSTPMPPFYDGCDGEEIWHLLVKHHPNVTAVLGAHVINGAYTAPLNSIFPVTNSYDTTLWGTRVLQSVYNPQYLTNAGNGYMQVWRVDPARNVVNVHAQRPDGTRWPVGAFQAPALAPATALALGIASTNGFGIVTNLYTSPGTNTSALTNWAGLLFRVPFSEGSGTSAAEQFGASNFVGHVSAWVDGPLGGYGGFFTTNDAACRSLQFQTSSVHALDAFTAALWVRPTNAMHSAPGYWFSIHSAGTDSEWAIGANSFTQLRCLVVTTNGSVILQPGVPSLANAWHHLALTYDGATVTVYLDGAAVTNAALTGRVTSKAFNVGIGGHYDSGVWPWKLASEAALADACIFNRALAPYEVANLATGILPGAEVFSLAQITNANHLTNWALLATNVLAGAGGGLTNQAPIGVANLTNAPNHLTNWALLETNILAGLGGTNTWNTTNLVVLTNAWAGTNDFAALYAYTNVTTSPLQYLSNAVVTNFYAAAASGQMAVDAARGTITNLVAGWYHVDLLAQGSVAGGGDNYFHILSNRVSVLRCYGYTWPTRAVVGHTFLWLPAGTEVAMAPANNWDRVQAHLLVTRVNSGVDTNAASDAVLGVAQLTNTPNHLTNWALLDTNVLTGLGGGGITNQAPIGVANLTNAPNHLTNWATIPTNYIPALAANLPDTTTVSNLTSRGYLWVMREDGESETSFYVDEEGNLVILGDGHVTTTASFVGSFIGNGGALTNVTAAVPPLGVAQLTNSPNHLTNWARLDTNVLAASDAGLWHSPDTVYLREEFAGHGGTSGSYGEMGWGLANDGIGTATVLRHHHGDIWGSLLLTTSATNNAGLALYLGAEVNTAGGAQLPLQRTNLTWRTRFRWRLTNGVPDQVKCFVGLRYSYVSGGNTTNINMGYQLAADPGVGTNWFWVEAVNATTYTLTDAGAAVNTNWNWTTFWRSNGVAWGQLNSGAPVAFTNQIPAAQAVPMFVLFSTGTNATSGMIVDFWDLWVPNAGRWP